MTRISLPEKEDGNALFGEEGRAKIVAVAAVVAGVVVFGGAMLFLATGDDSGGADEFVEEGFDQPFIGSDEDMEEFGDDDFLYGDDEEQEVAEDQAEEGPFKEFNREEYSAVLNETLQNYEPDEYEEAFEDYERQVRRAWMALTPDRRREVLLNHDLEMMDEILLDALRDFNPEAYERARKELEAGKQ